MQKTDETPTGQQLTIGCLLTLLLIPVGLLLWGWAVTALWGWFVLPLFGVPMPPLPLLYGLFIIAAFVFPGAVVPKCDTEGKSYNEKLVLGVMLTLGRPALAVFFGWLAHLCAR